MNKKFSRWHIRFKIKNITFFGLVSKTQTLGGITSDVGEDKHIILWDLDDCTKDEAIQALTEVQHTYRLGQIYLLSDKKNSFGAICFTKVDYMEMLRVLINTQFVDKGFIQFTAQMGKSTLRLTRKMDRNEQELICVIYSPYRKDNINHNIEMVLYDTGIVKRGVAIG